MAVREAKLELATLGIECDSNGTKELSVALVCREKLRHPVVIVAHRLFICGFRSHEARGNA